MDGFDPEIQPIDATRLFIRFGQLARFLVDFDARLVTLVEAHPQADGETINHLVDDHVAPRIIAAGGELVLHGSACVVGGRLAVFLGQTGAGKSTLAASLHAQGHRLLGDDAVVITEADGALHGEAVYPSLRLYRESIDQVFRSDIATSAMAFYSDKVHVAAAGLDAAKAERVALGTIYILTEGEAGVTLEPMPPADACMALVKNSFALAPHDQAAAARRMGQAARVAAAVPCYELAYPYDFGLLGTVQARIVASLPPQPPAAASAA